MGGSPVAPRQEARSREWRLSFITGDSTDRCPLLIAPPVAERQGYLFRIACLVAGRHACPASASMEFAWQGLAIEGESKVTHCQFVRLW